MTNKVELNRLTQVVHKEQAFLTALNENFLRLQQAINDTLSRSGVAPNEMEEVLDMNGKDIINVRVKSVEHPEYDHVVTKRDIIDLIESVEAAVTRLSSLVADAKTELALYAATNILPPAEQARDEAIAAKNAAKEYYDDTKALYDQLASLVQNLNALLAISEHLGDIVTVKENLSNINEVAAISEAITTCSNNIAAILAAPTYAEHAETWAEGSDADVAVLGGTHSAKRWAELSQADVAAEATARENADIGLQNQIDAIVASSDVRDIVGTYTDLQNYDTSTLGNNDIIKVLVDSTHNNATSYYKWIITGGVGAWSYIGSEGPYLTPGTAASTYVPLTRTINSKALSSDITLNASDVGAATAAQGAKADTALQNTATGTDSLTISGTASTNSYSVNIGPSSSAYINGTAVGNTARASGGGSAAFGKLSLASGNTSVALGAVAEATAQGAIMLGGGVNSEAQTFKVALRPSATQATDEASGLFKLLDSDGTIPAGRLPNAITSSQITIATTDWSGNTCTKSVSGVTATSDVFVSPEPVLANIKAYTEANVFCSAISAGTVTFTCETTPTDTLTVNIGVN